MRALIFIFILIFTAQMSAAQTTAGSLKGQVTDPLGAIIVGANVTLTGSNGAEKSVTTNGEGIFTFSNLASGVYVVRVNSLGFTLFEQTDVEIVSNSRRELNVQLSIAVNEQKITVGEENGLSSESENNASAIRLRDDEIEILPEDPAELEAALRALAGVSSGPDGGQIIIDGFVNTGQPLPPRSSIREIRINQNPFSAENDRLGFGQIQIITRPGTDKLRGEGFFNFTDESLNTRNPFAVNRAPYQMRFFGGNLSGAILPKRASFFASFNQRETADNVIINAAVLDENLNFSRINRAFVVPRRQINFNSRFDAQLTPNNTLTLNYNLFRSSTENAGIGGINLPERTYEFLLPIHTFQGTFASVFKSNVLNELRLQYIAENFIERGDNSRPTVTVSGAFSGGGANIGLATNPEGRLTVQDAVLWTSGAHTLRVGARLRRTTILETSPEFYSGTYTFTGGLAPQLDANGGIVRDNQGQPLLISVNSLERYRRTLLFQRRGFSPDEIRRRGGGASQFAISGGNPRVTTEQVDFGAYVQDDWRIRPNFTLAFGLRYEFQTNIEANLNLAPRVSFVWSPNTKNNANAPQTIIRGGFGIFYDRFNENQVNVADSFRGGFRRFVVTDPAILDLFPLTPSFNFLRANYESTQTIFRIGDELREPYLMQTAISIERQLPLKTTVSASYINSRTRRALRTRNTNAPVIVRNSTGAIVSRLRPSGEIGDVFEYESSGRINQNQLLLILNNRLNPRFSFFVNYTLNRAFGDTEGVGTFPADSNNLDTEYGRSSFDVRHNLAAGGTFEIPFGIRLNPLVYASSGRPFNVTTGVDANGDAIFTDRPALADDLTKPGVRVTPFGAFDPNPANGQAIIPRNFGKSPGYFIVNLNINRTFTFGGRLPAKTESQTTTTQNNAAKENPYRLTLGVRVLNVFNRVNFELPVGNISSPFFGQSVSTAGGFGAASVGNPAAGNRRVEMQIRFAF